MYNILNILKLSGYANKFDDRQKKNNVNITNDQSLLKKKWELQIVLNLLTNCVYSWNFPKRKTYDSYAFINEFYKNIGKGYQFLRKKLPDNEKVYLPISVLRTILQWYQK